MHLLHDSAPALKAAMKSGKQSLWPLAGIVLGALVSINPIYQPHLSIKVGIAALLVDIALSLILARRPWTARIGCLGAGLFLAVPCFVRESPLARGLLMCCMAFPLAITGSPLLAPPTASVRQRMTYLFTWLGTREVKRRARSFDHRALFRLTVVTVVFVAAMASVKAVPAAGSWLLVRWLGGGIMIMAAAEMLTACHDLLTTLMGLTAPSLMQSPHLSASVSEFWTRRWNPAASALLFRTFFFKPLARHGPALALCAAFLASALAHVLLPYMASGRWSISLACGAFFLVQPLFIIAERRLKVRRWRPATARAWTFAVLAIASPLFVEPALQLIEPSWGATHAVLRPTLAVLGFVMGVNLFFGLGSLAAADQFSPGELGAQPLTFRPITPAVTTQTVERESRTKSAGVDRPLSEA